MTAITVATVREISEGASIEAERVLWALAAFVPLAVGWSRLYLDEHWIDDVVGGLSAGVVAGLGAVRVGNSLPAP